MGVSEFVGQRARAHALQVLIPIACAPDKRSHGFEPLVDGRHGGDHASHRKAGETKLAGIHFRQLL